MNANILYTNELIDIINIPLEGGDFTKRFYIVEKNTNNGAYLPSINGFNNIREFKNSILILNQFIEWYKHDTEFCKRLNYYIEVYNSIKTNWADTKFIQ